MQQGDLGIDYSFARPDIGSLPPEIRFVERYVSHTPAKNISGIEAAAIALSGRELGLVWETTATRVLVGHDGGVQDGQAARAQADAIGYIGQTTWAVDFDLQPAQYDVAEQYGTGFAEGYGVPISETGPYGGLAFVEEMQRRGFGIAWQTVAWSHGKVSTTANIYQRVSATIPIPGTDENVALKTSGAAPIVVPTTPENTTLPQTVGSDGQRNLFVMHPLMTGPDVLAQQQFVNAALHLGLDEDSDYGPDTAAAVATLQSGNGLVGDGIVGPKTRALEAAIVAWCASLPAGGPTIPDFPGYVRLNDRGPAVGAFQQRLADRGYDIGRWGVDSKFGMSTLGAMAQFQRDVGIKDDGIGGPVTWTHLWS